jgi:hypothetical protein
MTGIETALLIAGAASAAGTGVAALGANKTAMEQSKALKQNAALQQQSATFEEANQRKQNDRFRAEQRVGYAASGVELTGSPTDFLARTAADQEMDALAIRYGGKVSSNASLYNASSVKSEGRTRAYGGLLQSAGQAGVAGYKYNTKSGLTRKITETS